MPLSYENLDTTTRDYMRAELERDLALGLLYRDPRLTNAGWDVWPALLREIVETHDDEVLAEALRSAPLLAEVEPVRPGEGRRFPRRVPSTAADTLAEATFNHLYARAVCLRALDEGFATVEVYRAKPVKAPRKGSDEKVGSRIDAQELLEDLREHRATPPALGVPAGPNSGLRVRIPRVAVAARGGL